MSTSETPFTVQVESDVETFVVDSSYALLRRELGPFSGTLPPGIYKFKFRRGLTIREMLFELPENPPAPVPIAPEEDLELESAAPLARSKHSDSRQVAAAREQSRKTQHSWGKGGSGIYLFARNAPDAPPRDVVAGLTLHTLDGELIVDAAQTAVREDAQSACAAVNVEVEPGAYRLRLARPDGAVEQIVVASPGWQTQVFLLHEAPTAVASPLALATASVLMCRDGGFDPDDEMVHLAEAARIALSLQRGTMPRHLLSRLLDEKFANPMLGIYAAHAITLEGAKDELLLRVLSVLDELVPGHPDVAALRLDSASNVVIDTPPMLRTSWNAIVAANIDRCVTLVPGSLASRIPSSLVGGTPWLIWQVDSLLKPETTAERDISTDLSAIEELIRTSLDASYAPIAKVLSGSEEALFSYMRTRASFAREETALQSLESLESVRSLEAPEPEPRQFDDRHLARAFGTTVQQVQAAVSGLANKLRSFKPEE